MITEDVLDWNKLYDAFVSYSIHDNDLIVNILIVELESGPNPLKLCLHYRDWLGGGLIIDQIVESVEQSRRKIIVFFRKTELCVAHYVAMAEI